MSQEPRTSSTAQSWSSWFSSSVTRWFRRGVAALSYISTYIPSSLLTRQRPPVTSSESKRSERKISLDTPRTLAAINPIQSAALQHSYQKGKLVKYDNYLEQFSHYSMAAITLSQQGNDHSAKKEWKLAADCYKEELDFCQKQREAIPHLSYEPEETLRITAALNTCIATAHNSYGTALHHSGQFSASTQELTDCLKHAWLAIDYLQNVATELTGKERDSAKDMAQYILISNFMIANNLFLSVNESDVSDPTQVLADASQHLRVATEYLNTTPEGAFPDDAQAHNKNYQIIFKFSAVQILFKDIQYYKKKYTLENDLTQKLQYLTSAQERLIIIIHGIHMLYRIPNIQSSLENAEEELILVEVNISLVRAQKFTITSDWQSAMESFEEATTLLTQIESRKEISVANKNILADIGKLRIDCANFLKEISPFLQGCYNGNLELLKEIHHKTDITPKFLAIGMQIAWRKDQMEVINSLIRNFPKQLNAAIAQVKDLKLQTYIKKHRFLEACDHGDLSTARKDIKFVNSNVAILREGIELAWQKNNLKIVNYLIEKFGYRLKNNLPHIKNSLLRNYIEEYTKQEIASPPSSVATDQETIPQQPLALSIPITIPVDLRPKLEAYRAYFELTKNKLMQLKSLKNTSSNFESSLNKAQNLLNDFEKILRNRTLDLETKLEKFSPLKKRLVRLTHKLDHELAQIAKIETARSTDAKPELADKKSVSSQTSQPPRARHNKAYKQKQLQEYKTPAKPLQVPRNLIQSFLPPSTPSFNLRDYIDQEYCLSFMQKAKNTLLFFAGIDPATLMTSTQKQIHIYASMYQMMQLLDVLKDTPSLAKTDQITVSRLRNALAHAQWLLKIIEKSPETVTVLQEEILTASKTLAKCFQSKDYSSLTEEEFFKRLAEHGMKLEEKTERISPRQRQQYTNVLYKLSVEFSKQSTTVPSNMLEAAQAMLIAQQDIYGIYKSGTHSLATAMRHPNPYSVADSKNSLIPPAAFAFFPTPSALVDDKAERKATTQTDDTFDPGEIDQQSTDEEDIYLRTGRKLGTP